ncbi:MAG: hypothetical protein ACRES9_04775 [Gammaproteobacteria bacterium]
MAVLAFPGISLDSKIIYALGLACVGLLTILVMEYLRYAVNTMERRLCYLLMGYFTVAFVTKLPFMLYLPETLWASSGSLGLSPEWIIAHLPHAFDVFLVGYGGFLLGVLLYALIVQSARGGEKQSAAPALAPERSRLHWLTMVIPPLLYYKWVLQHVYSIGVPGVIPQILLFPGLGGASGILTDVGLLYLINLGLFIAMISRRNSLALLYGLMALIFVTMDVAVGIKRDLLFEPFIVMWIYVFNRQWIPRKAVRGIFIAIVLFLGVGIPVYKYVNFYRAALLYGNHNIAQAAQVASSAENSKNSFASIYARIVGLDLLEPAIESPLSKTVTGNILTADVLAQFAENVVGTEAVTRYAITQIGRAYIVSGYAATFLALLVLAILYLISYLWILRRSVKYMTSRTVLSAVLGITYVSFLMSGSSPFLTLKTLVILILVAISAERVLKWSGSDGRKSDTR